MWITLAAPVGRFLLRADEVIEETRSGPELFVVTEIIAGVT